MGKNGVDGVYTADPRTHPDAVKYDDAHLRGGAPAAASRWPTRPRSALCMENGLPMVVFGMQPEGNILRVVQGEKIGTLVARPEPAGRRRGRRPRVGGDRPMIDETCIEADEKMEQGGRGRPRGVRRDPRRPRQPRDVQQDHRRLLRHPDPDPAAGLFTAPEARIILVAPYDMGALAAIEKAIRDSDLGVNPVQRRQADPLRLPRAHRGAPQGVHQARPHQGRGGPGRRSATSAATPSRRWTSSRRTARSARTTSPAPRRSSTRTTKKYTDQIDELLKHKEAELLEV